ncbi:MAG: hypothetical protein U0Q55_19525 [Vicinamibacterales bacterium]
MTTAQALVTLSVLVALAYLAVVSISSVVAALRTGGRREDSSDSYEALAASRLTMPVSVVMPVGDGAHAREAIARVLALNYPEFEVIVVVDAPADVSRLGDEWQLESREFFYRRTLETAAVRRIFRSLHDSRLMVVEKDRRHRSDALNCGVNLARYRFVAVVPPTVAFDRSALLRAMAPALRDPVSIVGVGSHIERVPDDRIAPDREARFQRLRSIRSLMFTRLFWGRLRHGLGPDDGVAIWRRDAVLQASGFSTTAANPDLDMMFRLQQFVRHDERRFVRHDETFGEAGTTAASPARAHTTERQRAALEAATWGPDAARSVGVRALAYFLQSELVTPIAQFWVVAATLAGAAAGWFTWPTAALSLLVLSFGTGAVSAAALLLRGAHPNAPSGRELRALLALAPLEVLIYSPRNLAARLAALGRSRPAPPAF